MASSSVSGLSVKDLSEIYSVLVTATESILEGEWFELASRKNMLVQREIARLQAIDKKNGKDTSKDLIKTSIANDQESFLSLRVCLVIHEIMISGTDHAIKDETTFNLCSVVNMILLKEIRRHQRLDAAAKAKAKAQEEAEIKAKNEEERKECSPQNDDEGTNCDDCKTCDSCSCTNNGCSIKELD